MGPRDRVAGGRRSGPRRSGGNGGEGGRGRSRDGSCGHTGNFGSHGRRHRRRRRGRRERNHRRRDRGGLHAVARRIRPAQVVTADRQRGRGQLHLGRRHAVAVPEKIPHHRHAGHGETGQTVEQTDVGRRARRIERDEGRRLAEGLPGQARQHGSGADFDEDPPARGLHGPQLVREPHRLGELRGEQRPHRLGLRRIRRSRRVVEHRHGRRCELHVRQKSLERRARVAHRLRVKRRRHLQPAERNLRLRQPRLQPLNLGDRSGDHGLLRTVLVGDHAPGAFAGQHRRQCVRRMPHRRHRAGMITRNLGHQLAALPADPQTVFPAEDARRVQRGDFAVAVSAHQLGPQPGRLEHREVTETHRAERRLGVLRAAQFFFLPRRVALVGRGRRIHDIAQPFRPEEPEALGLLPSLHRCLELHRQLPRHPHALAALTGEQIHEPRRAGGPRLRRKTYALQRRLRSAPRVREPLEQLARLRGQIFGRRRDDRRTARRTRVERLLARPRHGAELRGRRFRPRRHQRTQLRPGRPTRQKHLGAKRPYARRRGRPAVLLQRDVKIRAAEAERAHRAAPRLAARLNPRPRLGAQIKRTLGETQLGIGRIHIGRRRKRLMPQRERHLDHARRTGRTLRVTDLRFHRTERTPLPAHPVGRRKHVLQRRRLAPVARRRPRAVRLDEPHARGRVAGPLVAALQRHRLAFRPRRIDALRTSVRRRTEPADHRVNRIAVALGVLEPAQRQHPAALTHHRAVRRRRKRPAVPRRRHRGRLAEAHVHENRVQRVHAARDHPVARAQLQLADPHMQRRQRTRARRIRHTVGAAEIEAVRHAPRDDVAETTGKRVLVPLGEQRRDALRRLLHLRLRNARPPHALDPHRPREQARH